MKEKDRLLTEEWRAEKKPLEEMQKIKEQIDQANIAFAQAEREGDYTKLLKLNMEHWLN